MKEKHTQYNLLFFITLITYTVGLVMLIIFYKDVGIALSKINSTLRPFTVGIVIAYVINLPMRFIEHKVLPLCFRKRDISPTLKRIISIFLSFIFVIAVITAIIAILVPQIAVSVMTLSSNFDNYVASFYRLLQKTMAFFNIDFGFLAQFDSVWSAWFTEGMEYIKDSLPKIFDVTKNFTTSLVGSVVNTFVGIIVSVYILYAKDKLLRQIKRFIVAFLPERLSSYLLNLGTTANNTFRKFIAGQLIEAFIVGVLCFTGMSILGLPYALLISVIVGVTNTIPIVGPIVGAIPGAFILLMINPIQSLWFIIFIIILQQLESNLIYPRVVGSSIGLSGLWVMFAIFVGGGMFGFIGIFLGVPTFALIYKLLSDFINKKLEKKKIENVSIKKDLADE